MYELSFGKCFAVDFFVTLHLVKSCLYISMVVAEQENITLFTLQDSKNRHLWQRT
jgi:hypothetical protein